MGVAIRCILERDVPGVPELEGKILCTAFCGEAGGEAVDTDPPTNLVTLDFGGPKTPPASPSAPAPASGPPLFAPLGAFITGGHGVEWYDPAKGLVVVRDILTKLRAGTTVSLDPDFDFFDDDEDELTEAVTFDLETLEEILVTAQREGTRFRLMIDA